MTIFAKLNIDGTLTNVREIDQSDLMKCNFAILLSEHYREDGSCKCSNAEYRKMMIAEWGYSEDDFEDILLKD
jgi:hypothetical protein